MAGLRSTRSILILAACICWSALLPASPQTPESRRALEAGNPYVRAFTPKELNGLDQFWAAVQDPRGLMYFASNFGVLEYDGVTWRLIATPSAVRSLAVDKDGRVWVGAGGTFGYLGPDGSGQLKYVALLDKIPKEDRTFDDVYRTFATPDGVYFQSSACLFRWSGEQMKTWKPEKRFTRASYVNGFLYVGDGSVGMLRLVGDSLQPMSGFERFKDSWFVQLLPYADGKMLVADNGPQNASLPYNVPFYLYDGTALTRFPTEADAALIKARLYFGIALPDGNFAIASLNGLHLLNREGRLQRTLSKNTGLPSSVMTSLAVDREGALWVLTGNGIARVELQSPLTYYDAGAGVDKPYAVSRIGEKLYVGMETSLAVLEPRPAGLSRLRVLNGAAVLQPARMVSVRDQANGTSRSVLPSNSGLHEIRDDQSIPLKTTTPITGAVTIATVSVKNPSRVYIGTVGEGVCVLRLQNGVWITEGTIPAPGHQVAEIVEEKNGLWLGTTSTGIIQVTFPSEPGQVPWSSGTLKQYVGADGFPAGGDVFSVGGKPLFINTTGQVYRFDEKTGKFVMAPEFAVAPFVSGHVALGFFEDSHGNVWTARGGDIVFMEKLPDGSYRTNLHPFLHSTEFGEFQTGGAHIDSDGVAWFPGGEGLLRFDPAQAKRKPVPFSAMIRQVRLAGGDTIFGGAGSLSTPQLKSASNALRLEFAAPTFVDASATEFQQYLEGLDSGWSSWSKESRRDFTSLPPQPYRFHVKARNAYGEESAEVIYGFTILPPWYRTWWAYSAYLLAVALMLGVAAQMQRRRVTAREQERARVREEELEAQAKVLEDMVAERTREIAARAAELALINSIGQALASKLEVRSLIQLVGDQVRDVFHAEIAYVALLDKKSSMIHFPYGYGETFPSVPLGTGLVSRVIQSAEPLLINEGLEDSFREMGIARVGSPAASYLGVPILSAGEVVGVISVQTTTAEGRFSENDLRLLATIAVAVGGAMENALLFEQTVAARAAAEEADSSKSAFLSTVSHELRTPLTSVIGFAKIIRRRLLERVFPVLPVGDKKLDQTTQQITENLDIVVSEGERLTKLINDVLDLAKIEAGKIEWNMQTLHVPEIVERAIAATSALVENKPVKVVCDVAARLPDVTGDRDRLIQVVINLLSNAVKFTTEGTVTCRVRYSGGDVIVSVTDTGLGIAEVDQPKVFEKFKQVGDTLTNKPQGTGLGLPICKEIVEYHGGRIWVESMLGQGSTFSFALPGLTVVEETRVSTRMPVAQLLLNWMTARPREVRSAGSILVLDDDPQVLELLRQEFKENGRPVCMASNGRDALAMVRERKPSVVILDVVNPDLNGFDVAAVLRNDPETNAIPIMMLSILHESERRQDLGIDCYLTKPIDTDVLFREVETLMERGRTARA